VADRALHRHLLQEAPQVHGAQQVRRPEHLYSHRAGAACGGVLELRAVDGRKSTCELRGSRVQGAVSRGLCQQLCVHAMRYERARSNAMPAQIKSKY
jgi:hypothetical protein